MKPKSKLRSFLAIAGSTLLTITYAYADYYWDSDNATAGFGTTAGTWSSSVSSLSGNGFTTDATGATDITGNADVATTTSDSVFFGTATVPYTGTTTISGTVNAGYLYQGATHPNFAGTTPTINFAAVGTFESSASNRNFPAGTIITGAGTSLTWKSIRNLIISNVTSNAAKTILSTCPETTFTYPGRIKMKADANLGAANAPLEFDHGTLSMQSGFPYTSLSALNAAHPVSFVADKNAGLDNTIGVGITFTVDNPIDLGTGFFYPEGGIIKLTSNSNNWAGIKLTGILEISDLAQLGPTSAPLLFGTGSSAELGGGTLRITGTSVTSLGARPMLTTIDKDVRFDIADAGNTFTVDQLLNQGIGGFVKAGAGSLIISTTSTYTGLTSVLGGTLNFATAAALPTGPVTVNGADALLVLGSYNPSVGTVTLANGSVTGSGTLTGTSFVSNGTSPANMTVGVKLAGAAATLAKSGTGTATLSADNSGVGGAVTISGGVLNINSTTALGTGAVTISGGTIDATSGPTTLSTNNTITLGGNFIFGGTNALNLGTGAITMAATRIITLNGSGLTLGGVLTHTNPSANSTLTVNGPGNTLVIGGGYDLSDSGTSRTPVISGTGNLTINGPVTNGVGGATTCALTKTGTGTLTLNGNNTYGGLTTHSIAGSTLTLAGDNSGAGGGLTMNNSTAVLNINSAGALGTGLISLSLGTINNTSGSPKTLTTNNTVLLGGASITWGGSNNLTFGTGDVQLSATNRTINLTNAGTLTFGGKLVNTLANNTIFNVNGVGKTMFAAGLACSNTATLWTFTVQGDGNLTITGAVNGSSFAGSENIASLLTKSGTGTLTLQGANTYTGNTTVNTGGCLALVGGSQDSAITVNSGAFLGFTLGSPTTSTKAVTLSAGHKVRITGSPTPGVDYTLLTTSLPAGIGGVAPDIETPLATHTLEVEGAGTILVLKALIVSTPYDDWATLKGLTIANNAKTDDPDGDGKNNNFEFAFNGNPLSGSDNGMMAGLVQNASAPAGNELTLVAAVRDGATFADAGSPVVQTATKDGVVYTIEGTLDLVTIPGSDVSHAAGPSDTAPLATGLPDLTGSAWEYHTFKLDASEGLGAKGFLRAKVE